MKKTYYETPAAAAANVRLLKVREASPTVYYCKGINRHSGTPAKAFNNYYHINTLTKITNP